VTTLINLGKRLTVVFFSFSDTAMTFNPLNNSLLLFGLSLNILPVIQAPPVYGTPVSHQSPVRAAVYNAKFDHLVSGCTHGVRFRLFMSC
jgi:hypothetical protein